MPKTDNFNLQPVLNFKSNIVDILEVEFARLKIAHQNEVKALLQLEQAKNQELELLRYQQHKSILDCQAIQLSQQYLQVLDQRMTEQTTQVEKAQHCLEAKREELVKTMQDQKTLEKLRERHQARQQQELLRREARIVDDLVVARYKRER